jgi:hypothetical protein
MPSQAETHFRTFRFRIIIEKLGASEGLDWGGELAGLLLDVEPVGGVADEDGVDVHGPVSHVSLKWKRNENKIDHFTRARSLV